MEYSVPEFVKIAAYVVIFGFFWRTLAAYLAGKEDGTTLASIGRAMAVIY